MMSCCARAVWQPPHEVRRIIAGAPVCVDRCDSRLRVNFDRGCYNRVPQELAEEYKLHISRVGDPDWWVDYRGMEQDEDHNVVFVLDDDYFEMPPGRYFGEIQVGDCCYLIQMELPRCAPIRIPNRNPQLCSVMDQSIDECGNAIGQTEC